MRITLSALWLASFTLTASVALAHTGATGIVKERMSAMKALGRQSKTVTAMFRGKTDFDKSKLSTAADLFVQHGEQMLSQFPDTPHSRTGKTTEALPKIWDDWAGFTEAVDEFIARSESLQQTIATTDDQKLLRESFTLATKSCSGCHKVFRQPKR
jgi:cytochrome c556